MGRKAPDGFLCVEGCVEGRGEVCMCVCVCEHTCKLSPKSPNSPLPGLACPAALCLCVSFRAGWQRTLVSPLSTWFVTAHPASLADTQMAVSGD